MADNVVAGAAVGTGPTFRTDDLGVPGHVPYAKLMDGTDGGTAGIPGDATNGLFVNVKTAVLPTGAATAAKQPALGTAGAASADVLTVQGVASMTPLLVNNSANVQPVSDNSGSLTMDFTGQKTSDLDTGVGTDTVLLTGIALPASGGSVVGGTSTNPIRTDPTGTTAQPVTDNGGLLSVDDGAGTLTVDAPVGTPVFVRLSDGTAAIATLPVSAASLPLPTGAATETTLAAASAKLPAALGQLAMAASMSVALASNQSSIPVAATLTAETTKVIGTVNVAASQTIAATNAGTFAVQAGQAAHDAAIAGSPVRVALRGMSADYTAVATGDVADALGSLLGKMVILTDSLPANTWSYAAPAGGLVTTTGVTAKAAAAAGVRNYVSKAQIINSHQTIGTEVVIRDGAAGAVLWRGWAQFTGGGAEVEFKPPLRGTAATLIEIAEVTATATAGVLVNLQGYVASE